MMRPKEGKGYTQIISLLCLLKSKPLGKGKGGLGYRGKGWEERSAG